MLLDKNYTKGKKLLCCHCEPEPHPHRNRWGYTFRGKFSLQESQLCLSADFVARLHTVQDPLLLQSEFSHSEYLQFP